MARLIRDRERGQWSDDRKGGLATFRPQLEQLSLVTGVLRGRPYSDTTMATQNEIRPQKKLKPDPFFFRTHRLDFGSHTLQGGGGSKTRGSKESFEDMGNRRWFLGVLHCQTK